MSDLEQVLIMRSVRAGRIVSRLFKQSRQLSRWRLTTFLTVAAIAAVLGYVLGQAAGWSAFLVGLIPFSILVYIHQRIEKATGRWTTWANVTNEDLARLRLDWDHIPPSGVIEPAGNHPYSSDLNICGNRSLTHLVDLCVSQSGSDRLGYWLLDPELDADVILKRQRLIQDLVSIPYVTQKLRWVARIQAGSDKRRWNTNHLVQWLQASPGKKLDGLLKILAALSVVNFVGFTLWMVGLTPGWWVFSFITYVAIYGLNGGALVHLSAESADLHEYLGRFRAMFKFLSKRIPSLTTAAFELTFPFRDESEGPLASLKRLRKIALWAGVSRNDVLFVVLNALVPWNLIFTVLLEREKSLLRSQLPGWLDRWYTLEAAASLAHVAVLNTDHCWPVALTSPEWYAEDASHPLLHSESRVCNTHHFDKIGRLGLITGSNMAGKSTFLRTVGINTVLANAGGPTIAMSFSWQPMRVFTSMKISDSVTEGYSYFYAEVRRLKSLFDELKKSDDLPQLYLIDEIFKGTNTKERLIGSRGYIHSLIKGNGFGLVATHDLELIKLSQESDLVRNLHFEETFTAGNMHFTYKLMNGPCTSTNALHIMRQAGLEID